MSSIQHETEVGTAKPQRKMSKSEKIHSLVQRMKSGSLSKNELFSQLSKLQRTNDDVGSEGECTETKDGFSPTAANFSASVSSISSAESDADNDYSKDNELDDSSELLSGEDEYVSSSSPQDKIKGRLSSTPERRAIIQKLFEEKRRQRMQGKRDLTVNTNSEFKGEVNIVDSGTLTEQRLDPKSNAQASDDRENKTSNPESEHTEFKINESFNESHTPRSPSSYQGNDVNYSRNSLDELELEASWNSMYHNRQQRESKMRQDLEREHIKECTFRPSINRLPAEYGVKFSKENKSSFNERMKRWSEQKKLENLKRQREVKKNELQGCTFSPQINKVKNNKGSATAGKHASDRLYAQSKDRKRAEQIARARAEKEKEEMKGCTFKPSLSTSNPTYVRSRYRNPSPRRRSSPHALPTGTDECSFTPKINKIPDNMNAAKVYVSNNIFDRLTKARNEENQSTPKRNDYSENDSMMDMSTFMSGLENKQRQLERPSTAPRGGKKTESRRASTPRGASKKERQKDFERFLARQNQREIRKQQKLEQVARQNQQSHTPKLCKKSLQMAGETKNGSFLQRVAKDALRKEHHFLRKKAQAQDPECTFKPKITQSAKERPARSVVELSRGDSLKKETNARLMKLKAEQEELSGLTFQPKLNEYGPEVEGRLKVVKDPENYLARIQQSQHKLTAKQRRSLQLQEMKELSECTFRPRIHEAPTYVKRIVRSLSLARKENEEEKKRPDWR